MVKRREKMKYAKSLKKNIHHFVYLVIFVYFVFSSPPSGDKAGNKMI